MKTASRWLVMVLALAILGILAAGVWFYRNQEQNVRRSVEADLQAVGQLKTDQIAWWRAERLADGAVISESPLTAAAVARWMTIPQTEETEQLLTRFRSWQRHYHCRDVLLVDSRGQMRLSLSGLRGSLHRDATQALAEALRDRRTVMTDLHAGPGDLPPHTDTIAPLFIGGVRKPVPVGAIVLQSDARQFLYPLIQTWPTPSRSAETLLVRREGDAVLYLNDLRHEQNTALKLRIPLTRKDVPSVLAVLGREGIVQGKDYRGVEVLAALKAIPDSPWFIVSKIDAAEAFAPWRSRAFLIVALVLSLVFAAAALVAVLWQVNQKEHFQARLRAEAARHSTEERYGITLKSIGDGVIVTDAGGRVELVNPVAEALTGWRQEEARGRMLEEVFRIINEETREPVENPASRVVREGFVTGLANHTVLIVRDGTERPIADSGAPIRDEKGQIVGAVLVFRDQTEERRAQRALRESEERFREFFDNAPMGKCMTAPDGRLLRVNRAFCSMLGFSADEMQSMLFAEITHPDDLEESREGVRSLLAGERDAWETDKRYVAKDGRIVWAHVATRLQRDAQGNPLHLLTHIQDITERNQAEEALRQSEAILNDTGSIARIGGWEHDLVTGQATWTKALYDIDELESSSPPGPNEHLDQYLPRDRAILATAYQRAVETGEPFDLELQVYTAKKRLIWGRAIGRPTMQGGKCIRMVGAFQDITERKRAEEGLRLANERFRRFVDSNIVGIIIADPAGAVIEANEYYLRMIGYTREEFQQGKVNWRALTPTEWLPADEQAIRELHERGTCTPYEKEYLRRDGTRVSVFLADAMLPGPGEQIAAFALDMTERKRAEEEIRRLNEDLIRSNKELEQFAYVASHDLQEPLRMVSSYTQLLADRYEGRLDQDAHDFIRYAVEGANRMQRLIQDLLAYSRVTTRGSRFAPLDLHEALGEAVANLQTSIDESAAVVTNAELPTVNADRSQMVRVFQNLVGNAIKFRKKDEPPRVHIWAERAGEEWIISVKDNGIGIDPQYVHRIFVIFQRLHGKEEYPGTGIGLALCQRIVMRHGGKIWVESSPGEGSMFRFTMKA